MQEASNSSSSSNSTTSTHSTPSAPSTPTPVSPTTEPAASSTPPFSATPTPLPASSPVSVPTSTPTPSSPPLPPTPIDPLPDEKTPNPITAVYQLLLQVYPLQIPKHRQRDAYIRLLDKLMVQQAETGLDANALQKLNTLRKTLESTMQQATDSTAPASSKATTSISTTPTTAVLSKARFIAILDGYMQDQQEADELIALSSSALYDLIKEDATPEKLLFHPVFMGTNLPDTAKPEQYKTPEEIAAEQKGERPVRKLQPPTDDRRRAYALSVVCAKLQEHKDGAGLLKTLLQKQTESDAKTVLHVAAQGQYSVHVILYLLQLAKGLQLTDYVNIVDDRHAGVAATPLYFAAERLQIDNMAALLGHGANPLVKTGDGVSLYETLLEKSSDELTPKAMALLREYSRPVQAIFKPYLDLSNGSDAILKKIIRVKTLADFAHSKQTHLAAFVRFLQALSMAFSGEEPVYTRLRERFLAEFAQVQTTFGVAAAAGVLNADGDEQREILAVASWLLSQKQYRAAQALLQRLLTDRYSIFLQDKEVYKMLRWAGMCIGKIYVEQKKIAVVDREFLTPLHELDNLEALRDLLEAAEKNPQLPSVFRQEIVQLVSAFHRGQAHHAPLLVDSAVPAEIKPLMPTSPSKITATVSASTDASPQRLTITTPPPKAPPSGIGYFGTPSASSGRLVRDDDTILDSKGEDADRRLAEKILLASDPITEKTDAEDDEEEHQDVQESASDFGCS